MTSAYPHFRSAWLRGSLLVLSVACGSAAHPSASLPRRRSDGGGEAPTSES